MKKINRETIRRIIDAADIVDVVSDFVRLKKKGANYVGLCPFHSERTPSFSVSKSKGICKCFSCGKGGNAVGFIMEHESLNYFEALRYLAKKYNIEVKEEEVSEEEQQADRERESMFVVNEWASGKYAEYLFDTEKGRDIGLSYFRERGLNDPIIKKYKLGYSIDLNTLPDDAAKDGFANKYLLDTGLCYLRQSTGKLVDRYCERVIFPIFTVSGKVVAFGGRTLKTSKEISKYINSPESIIYSKSRELYGLYQAKSAIVKKGFCILVEGYMDVLSMAQSGIENIVASSGTSLTEGQIRLIHRFTDRVTLMYDSDPAGIKAALRGVDLLLAEGLDINIVLLPDGEDPDSFAQGHSSTEVEEYITQKAEDFIRFKTKILMKDTVSDPLARSRVISEIVQSIASIPDEIKRLVYCQECSRMLDVKEDMLLRQVALYRTKKAEKDYARHQLERQHEQINRTLATHPEAELSRGQKTQGDTAIGFNDVQAGISKETLKIYKSEENLLRYIVRYAFKHVFECIDDSGNQYPMNVLDFIKTDLEHDKINFLHPVHEKLFLAAIDEMDNWEVDALKYREDLEKLRESRIAQGIEDIRKKATDIEDINRREKDMYADIEAEIDKKWDEFSSQYFENKILVAEDMEIRNLALNLIQDKHPLSRYHTKYIQLPTEADQLQDLLGKAVNSLKYSHLEDRIAKVVAAISDASRNGDIEKINELMKRKQLLDKHKSEFARILGDRVYS